MNAKKFALEFPEAVECIINNFYMNDFLASFSSCTEAKFRVSKVIKINAAADWEMHGWADNEPEVLDLIENAELSKESSTVDIERREERILGLH